MTHTLEHPPSYPSPDSPDTGPPQHWRLRTKVLIGVGALVAVAGGIVGLDYAVSETQHQSRAFQESVTAVDADIAAGSLRIVASDQPGVSVEMTVRSGLRSPSHSESVVNGHLVIHSGCGFAFDTCWINYVIRVPEGVAVTAHGDGDDIDLVGMTGDVDVSLNGGDAHLGFAGAPVHVKARANGGRIVIAVPDDGQAYHVNAKSEGGSTHVDVRTDPASDHVIDAHVSGGSVVVQYNK